MSKQNDAGQLVQAFLGVTGVALGLFFPWLIWRVLASPGDDNPITLLFMAGAGLSVIPAWGLVRCARGKRLTGFGWVWLAAAVLVLVVLVPLAAMFAR